MKSFENLTNFINLFIICLIINVPPSFQILNRYEIEIPTNKKELSNFFFTIKGEYNVCEKWVPSLFNPILLVSYEINKNYREPIFHDIIDLRYLFLNENKRIKLNLYSSVNLGNYKFYLGKAISNFYECYFGLSPNNYECNELREGINNLNILKENNQINKKVFSFNMWTLKNDSIKSNFYLGDEHEIFRTNNGIIANFTSNYSFWGCEFNEIIFNEISIPLLNKDGNLYQIHFALETHNIIFPNNYKEIFLNKTNNLCNLNRENYLICMNIFNEKEYIPIKLINENMTIIAEIDNLNRFNIKDESKVNATRITFEDIDYIVFPLKLYGIYTNY